MFNLDDIEFDVQKTILKKKKIKDSKFYVTYDKLTYQIISIAPHEVELTDPRHSILDIEDSSLVQDIFQKNLPLHKLKIRYDAESGSRILYKYRENKRCHATS